MPRSCLRVVRVALLFYVLVICRGSDDMPASNICRPHYCRRCHKGLVPVWLTPGALHAIASAMRANISTNGVVLLAFSQQVPKDRRLTVGVCVCVLCLSFLLAPGCLAGAYRALYLRLDGVLAYVRRCILRSPMQLAPS